MASIVLTKALSLVDKFKIKSKVEGLLSSARSHVDKFQIKERFQGLFSSRVIIIGLPSSGKTVFFCTGMDALQRRFNELEGWGSVIYEDPETEEFVTTVVNSELRNQKWPESTGAARENRVSIRCKNKKMTLLYREYGGEAFLEAFKWTDSKGADRDIFDAALSQEKKATGKALKVELLEDVKAASDIVLVLDSSMILNTVDRDLSVCLFNLLTTIRGSGFSGRIAVVFTKGDILGDLKTFSFEDAFKRQQPNSYARLREMGRYKMFIVSPVKCDVSDEDGRYVPPQGYSSLKDSENILAPFCWLLGLNESEKTELENVAAY